MTSGPVRILINDVLLYVCSHGAAIPEFCPVGPGLPVRGSPLLPGGVIANNVLMILQLSQSTDLPHHLRLLRFAMYDGVKTR